MDECPKTVLLADHHTMFREGLDELLTSDGTREFEARRDARAGADAVCEDQGNPQPDTRG